MKRHAPRLAITRARSSLSACTYTRSSTARGATCREKYDTTELAATAPAAGKKRESVTLSALCGRKCWRKFAGASREKREQTGACTKDRANNLFIRPPNERACLPPFPPSLPLPPSPARLSALLIPRWRRTGRESLG